MPITKLPVEILVWIFCDLRDMHAQSYSHGWLYITHVCRGWRVIALDAAELWTQIYSVDPDCVQAFLTNSKNAPLCILYPLINHRTTRVDAILPMLLSESSRLRCVELMDPGAVYKFLAYPFPDGTPALNSLHLDLHLMYRDVAPELIHATPRFCEHGPPALRWMWLGCWPVASLAPIHGLVNSSLRGLVIVNPRTRHSARAWTDILTELPLLEELTLKSVFALSSPGAVPLVEQSSIPVVHLPHLSAMTILEDELINQLSLMQQITASSNVDITLNTIGYEASFEQYTGILHALGQKFMRGQRRTISCPTSLDLCLISGGIIATSSDGNGGFVTSTSHELRVTISAIPNDRNGPYCPHSSSTGGTTIFSLQVNVQDALRYDFSTPLFDMLRTTFSWSTLCQLRLAPPDRIGAAPGQGAAGFAACRDLFLQMTNVRELSIARIYLSDGLLAIFGIVDTSTAPQDQVDGIAQLPFPVLEVLTIKPYRRKNIPNCEHLGRILLSRKAAGYPVLRVHICPLARGAFMPDDPDDIAAKLRTAVVPLASAGCSVDACIDKNGDGNWCVEELMSAN